MLAMPRSLSHAFASKSGERAAIDKFSRHRAETLSSRSQALRKQRRIALVCILVAACGLSALGYRAWSDERAAELVQVQTAEGQRAALRFGEIRVPISNNKCIASTLDNARGFTTTQSIVPCVEPLPAAPDPSADGGVGPAARAKAMSNAFRH